MSIRSFLSCAFCRTATQPVATVVAPDVPDTAVVARQALDRSLEVAAGSLAARKHGYARPLDIPALDGLYAVALADLARAYAAALAVGAIQRGR